MLDHDDAGSRPQVAPAPSPEADRLVLGAIVDDGEARVADVDDAHVADVGYYDAFSDPLVRTLDEIRQRRVGRYLRRMKRRHRPQSHGRRGR